MGTQNLMQSPLGKANTICNGQYNFELLFPVPREVARQAIGVNSSLPFYGYDLWNSFEFSWLNPKGKPIVALAQFIFPTFSKNLIESKSFKLYLNSFHNTPFSNWEDVRNTLQQDLSKKSEASVEVELIALDSLSPHQLATHFFEGDCLDSLDIETEQYTIEDSLLTIENEFVSETLYSDLFKSNCLMTSQPDWGSVQINYTGRKINHSNLLKYFISFRHHTAFNEHCVEKIFMDITKHCLPKELTVTACYTRRGGLSISPCRSSNSNFKVNYHRLFRQ